MLEGELFYAFGSSRISLRRVESARVVMPEKAENPMVVGARLARSSRLSLDASSRGGHLLVRARTVTLPAVGLSMPAIR